MCTLFPYSRCCCRKIDRFVIAGKGMPAPCLVLLNAVQHGNCVMFLLLDLLGLTSAESFLFPFLASFKTMFVQRACSVSKQQYGKTILYLLSSARKKNIWICLHFLIFVTMPSYLKQSGHSISTYPALILQNYHKPPEIWESDVSFNASAVLQDDRNGRGSCHCISQGFLVEVLIDYLSLGRRGSALYF